MARFQLLLLCCLASALAIHAADPEVCTSDGWDGIALPPAVDADAAAASQQLARFVAKTTRLKPGCKVRGSHC